MIQPTLLVIDDDRLTRNFLAKYFIDAGMPTVVAASGAEGLEVCERESPDIVILDLNLPGLSGLQVLEIFRERHPEVAVVMLTGNGDVASAVHAMQLGAEHFFTKPAELELLSATISRVWEKIQLRRRSARYEQPGGPTDGEVIVRDPGTAAVVNQLELLAAGSAPVLLTGETGTGKGWAARLVHRRSARASAPFIEVNCAGLTPTFLDSELFGHEKGAFTDAKATKRGLFELADGGTLFLDEIGDLAPDLQPKLLKAIESKTFRRIGGTREIAVDVRFVAATNRDLAKAVQAGEFRQDLYYRLAVLPLRMPSLRERGTETIDQLAAMFAAEHRAPHDGQVRRLSVEAARLLRRYQWPGNVRELRNVIERAAILAGTEPEIRPEHLPVELRAVSAPDSGPDTDLTLRSLEERHIARMLDAHDHNRLRTARALGIARVTLYKKMREYGLERTPEPAARPPRRDASAGPSFRA